MSDRHIDVFHLSSQLTNNFLSKIITGCETWCFKYDPEGKQQNLQWEQPASPLRKKACIVKSNEHNAYIESNVHFEFIPQEKSTELIMWKY